MGRVLNPSTSFSYDTFDIRVKDDDFLDVDHFNFVNFPMVVFASV